MNKDTLTTEYRAYQDIRREFAVQIEEIGPTTASASELRAEFGITPTVLRRLVSSGRVRPVRRSRRRNSRVRYRLREVLRAVVGDGVYATGRVRNGSHNGRS